MSNIFAVAHTNRNVYVVQLKRVNEALLWEISYGICQHNTTIPLQTRARLIAKELNISFLSKRQFNEKRTPYKGGDLV